MSKPLLSLPATSRQFRRLLGTAAGFALALAAPAMAQAQTIFGLSGTDLTSVNLAQPLTSQTRVAITGITAGQTLVGIDFRPATGELFALGYDAATAGNNSRLYVLNQTTAVATAVGGAAFRLELGGASERIGFDFNPTVDRIRVVSTNDNNYRLNPVTGGLVTPDGALAFVAGDTNVGQNPYVGTAAYTNSFIGTASTTLYYIDEQRSLLLRSDTPNSGTLATVATLAPQAAGNATPINAPGASTDLDIYTFAPGDQQSYLSVNQVDGGGNFVAFFYRLNLTTGATTFAGAINGQGVGITDIAIRIDRTAPAASGQLLYGVTTGNSVISFYSGTPGFINTSVPLSGVTAGQTIVGTDYRPATGQFYALGYDAATAGANSQLYVIDPSSGVAAPVAAATRLELGGSTDNIGFDFNPTVDRIRVVSTSDNNYRLNPDTGLSAATDGTLAYAAGDVNVGQNPRVGSVGYTNSFAGSTATTLYDIDEALNILTIQNPPNSGTLNTVGSGIGLAVNPNNALVDLDIYYDAGTNRAFLTANPGGQATSNLYTLNLTQGTPTLLGAIGLGIPVRDLSAFIAAPFSGLTWTGAVSTDWGTAGNWSPAQVPTATDNVSIPDVANDPVVSNAQQANGVTLGSGATLTTATGGTLTVNGAFTNNGGTTLGSGTGTVAFNGAAAQTISGSTTFFNNLTAGPSGVVASAPVQVQRVLQLNGNLASGGNLTLLSNATGTAHVINNGGTVTGNAAVQRFIGPNPGNTGAGYRHYSAPVNGSTVADLATGGFTPVVNPAYNGAANPGGVTPFPTVFGYDETRVNTSGNPAPQDFDKGFFSPAALTSPLTVTQGYTVNIPASQTVDFVGVLNNGPVNASGLTRGTQTESGWQLLGNPYPSPLNWDLVGRSNVGAAVYVYRSTGQYAGTYSTYVANGAGTNGGTNVLGVAQGFFVRVSTPNTNSGLVSFTNAARFTTYQSPVFNRNATISGPLVRLELRAAAGPADEAVVYLEPGATVGFDDSMDAYKLTAGGAPVLAAQIDATTRLAVNALPPLTASTTDRVVALTVQAQQAGPHTLQATELLNLSGGTYAYLRDAQTGTVVDLQAQPSYTFTLASTAAVTGRFSLLLTQARVLTTAPAALAKMASVYPNPARGTATVLLPVALRGQQATVVTVVDNVGRAVLTRTLAAGVAETLELPLTGVAPGVYSVLARTASGLVAKRLVVE